ATAAALALTFVVISCGGDGPFRPARGSLSVAIAGLPDGATAAVSVSGPDGFTQTLTATTTLSQLVPGSYTVSSSNVGHAGFTFAPAVASQVIAVTPASPANAAVLYTAITGRLAVEISGLPDGSEAPVTVTGPSGDTRTVANSSILEDLPPGEYTIAAEEVVEGATTFGASPSSQVVTVAVGSSANATVSYAVIAVSTLNLRIEGMYVTQSVQTFGGAVPLVTGKDGYLRVFVTANETNSATPSVRARIFHGTQLTTTLTMSPAAPSVPTAVNEDALSQSWNVALPGSVIRPGLGVAVDVDPDNTIVEVNEADNGLPASGQSLSLEVRTPPPFQVRFIPVEQSTTGLIGDVSVTNVQDYLRASRALHPLVEYDADVHATYTTTAPPLQIDDANGSWLTIMNELLALRIAEAAIDRHYYGVVRTPYDLGLAGLGFLETPVAVGWDRDLHDLTRLLGASNVAAHEWGHNWGRLHSPCGNPGGVDPNYPYGGGTIGVTGFNVPAGQLVIRFSADIMGYCDFPWISDYTYRGILEFRGSALPLTSSSGGARQSLLVWGRIDGNGITLEPAFQVVTRPSLPRRAGAYTVEGLAADGARLFSLSFDGELVADFPRERGGAQAPRHFAFAVPLGAADLDRLAVLRASGPGAQASVTSTVALRPLPGELDPGQDLRAAGSNRVEVRWNAATYPMAMIRDAESGEILSFARGGAATLRTSGAELEMQFSDRVRTVARRVRLR
ncbi:MAG TPA: hypothetical protein VJ596_01740, partial [Gemmatimonadaceae bacterium]|nr:hypothetical protein [Gemmatimonadaceae bacterium]